MKLSDRVALVTGSSQGIGLGIAIRLAAAGASVILNYRSDPQEAEGALAQVKAAGQQAHLIRADLSSVGEAQRLVAEAIDRFGKIDILVNNAGIEKKLPFLEISEAEYDKVLNVNLKGVFFATQAFVQHLRDSQRPGKVINISSTHEELPFPGFTTYCISKGGLKMLTRNLAIELAPLGITVNSIAPGAIATPINQDTLDNPEQLKAVLQNIPLNRLGQPQDVAGAVEFLASADADYITGTTLVVDGGLLWNYQEK